MPVKYLDLEEQRFNRFSSSWNGLDAQG